MLMEQVEILSGVIAPQEKGETSVNENGLHELKFVRYSSHAVFELKLMSECIPNNWRG